MSIYHFSDTEAVEHDVNTVPAFGDFERVEIDGQWYVPERTCMNVSADPLGFECSECGSYSYGQTPTVWNGGPIDWAYCPSCGAEVVDDED